MAADPEFQIGGPIEWGWVTFGATRAVGYTVNVDIEEVKQCLRADAAITLPAGAHYELRRMYPMNYGRTHGMIWYSDPSFAERETWGEVPLGKGKQCNGYILIGEFTVPTPKDGTDEQGSDTKG